MRDTFTGIPKEFFIPPHTEIIFVADFFAEDLLGGAELTSEAIIRAAPKKLFKLHSSSLTEKMILNNKHKIWVFGNQTMVRPHILQMFVELNITYYFFEYDYKPCLYRSTKKHELAIKQPCPCASTTHGRIQSKFMTNAKVLFWCSDRQRDKFYNMFPELKGTTQDFTQSSTFYPETILKLRELRFKKLAGELEQLDRWVVLGSDSWIKGTDDAIQYCKENHMDYVVLRDLPNDQFLLELAKSKGLVFFPRDIDVGSRLACECKLLGGISILNDNVLPIYDSWYNDTIENIEQYLLDGPERFWRVVRE